MIKPEFWVSDDTTKCTFPARLLFIGMWNFCDDRGMHPFSTKTLKMEVFPGDNFSPDDIEDMLAELIENTLIRILKFPDGKKYIHVINFQKHQTISHPNFKYPDPQQGGKVVGLDSDELPPEPPAEEPDIDDHTADEARAFVEYINQRLGRKYRFTEKYRRGYRARIKDGFVFDQFTRAFENAMASAFHREKNFNYLTPEFFTQANMLNKWMNATVQVNRKDNIVKEEMA